MTMRDKPILFSAPMVQAILREIREPGTGKTQTRRVLNLSQMHPVMKTEPHTMEVDGSNLICRWTSGLRYDLKSPFRSSDRLWVRETWREWHDVDNSCGCSDHCACKSSTSHPAAYRADGDELTEDDREIGIKWKPSIFMPRWASRITLEVTDVRVQRLQEISESDAIAEGVEWLGEHDRDASDAFSRLWDSLNADLLGRLPEGRPRL
jgi:hypothetical protein